MSISNYTKGRGAQHNSINKFEEFHQTTENDFLNYCEREGEEAENRKTQIQKIFPKTLVNKVHSPDVGMDYSANPYQGCEHGCVYCYARNSHEYWGYSAGKDFEQQILVKENAPELLDKKLKNKNWEGEPIVFSGNTDCYQPVERQLEITRQCLKVFLKHKHPVGIITKNALILRDMDILQELAQYNLIRVNMSITSLSESTRRLLEPRTATIKQRLKVVQKCAENNIPVGVMMAPIIPGINSHEIFPVVEKVADSGAESVGHQIVRLNGSIGEIFENWIKRAMPDRAEKVLNQIAECHGGQLNDSRFGKRMKGEGEMANQIHQQFKIAKSKFMPERKRQALDSSHYLNLKNPQMSLF